MIVEDCFNITLLVQTLICTAMFCLTGYRMITVRLDIVNFLTISISNFSYKLQNFPLQSVDREEADVPIVGIIFFIIHVIYTMLHLFIYCYVGETLLGEVVCYPTNILVFSSPKEKWNTGFSEHRYWPVNVPLQLVRFTIETSSFINDRDTPCKRVVSNNSWKIQPVLP